MNDPKLFGGWTTTKERATDLVAVTLNPGQENEGTIKIPITDNPDDSLPMGTQKLGEPVILPQ